MRCSDWLTLTRTFALAGSIAAENARDESRKSFGSGISL
jgi:hypothetical protein